MIALAVIAALLLPTAQPAPCAPELEAQFRCGYEVRAQGDPYLLGLEDDAVVMVGCESRWLLDPGPRAVLGLAQLEATYTWPSSRRAPDASPFDAWEQGYAVASWLAQIADPAGSSGWASCWPR